MAVLEKIRKQSVLLFIIIIGALLAFILGDFLNSGRSFFGPGDTVAEVGGVEVKYNRYSELVDNINEAIKADRANAEAAGRPYMKFGPEYNDPDYVSENALQTGIMEVLYNREYDLMGIDVTDELLQGVIFSPAAANQVMGSLFVSQDEYNAMKANGIVDVASFRDAIDTPSRYGLDEATAQALSERWKKMEDDLERQLKYMLYSQMLGGLFQPNKADALVYYENMNDMATVDYVAIANSTVTDAKVEDADIEAVYEENKGAFRAYDEVREIAYIKVPIEAARADFEAAEKAVSKLKADLAISEGTTALSSNKGFKLEDARLTADVINSTPQLAALRDNTGLHAGLVRQLMTIGNRYTVAKITDVTEGIDNVVFAISMPGTANEIDSIFKDRSITAVDSVITKQGAGMLNSLKTSLINPGIDGGQQMAQIIGIDPNMFLQIPAVMKALETTPLKEFTIVNDTINGQALAFGLVVKDRAAAKPVYETSIMTYEVFPSSQTRTRLSQDLHSYVANNASASSFVEKAAEAGYTVEYNIVDKNSFSVGNGDTPHTRSVVKWIMDADKDKVSPVFTISNNDGKASHDYFITAVVTDIIDEDYVPATTTFIKESLKSQALANKQAKTLIDRYAGKGKTLADYSKVMGVAVNSGTAVFGNGQFGNQAQGAVAGAKKGAIVGPVQGNGQVYVFEVKDVKKADVKKADLDNLYRELGSGYSNVFRSINTQNPRLFVGESCITNNMLHFTQDLSE